MAGNMDVNKFMTKPLPEILAEIATSITKADEAANSARVAALEAHKTSEKTVQEAIKRTNERLSKVEQVATNSLQQIELIRTALSDGLSIVNDALQTIDTKGRGLDRQKDENRQ